MESQRFLKMNGKPCACGKEHAFHSLLLTGDGAILKLPEALLEKKVKKVYMLADQHTYAALGARVEKLLTENGITVSSRIFEEEHLEPDEKSVGSAAMHYPQDADAIVAVGSGVLNDIGKIISSLTGKLYVIAATAPSMDGYASDSSSVTRGGHKISLPTRVADIIVGDNEVLAAAPERMMISGLGDMIAKYVSLAEWRIAHLLLGEYYCEEVASLVREAVEACVRGADALLSRDKAAAGAVFEGLVLSGIAMKYAGVSRPASGVEHYLSHVWDMRAIAFDTPTDFHGIQCGIGTLYAAKMYEKLSKLPFDEAKGIAAVEAFDYGAWSEKLREFLGECAKPMIALEAKEGKYDKEKHKDRVKKVIENRETILRIAKEEIPSAKEIEALLDKLGAPKTAEDIGLSADILPMTFLATKDIRDKYVLSRLAFDLGVCDELLEAIR